MYIRFSLINLLQIKRWSHNYLQNGLGVKINTTQLIKFW